MTSSPAERPARPSGEPPPAESTDSVGRRIDLVPLADEIARRYLAEFPGDLDRYGEAAVEWCVHDNRWLLHWAILDTRFDVRFHEQVDWLARILQARVFPLDQLARDLEIAGEVVRDLDVDLAEQVGSRFAEAAARVRERA